ncbi:DUF4870 domain-containing protein [Flavobacterium sp.]|uniref:DUF4870 domain-containing protein n=1 Tax=Flavobacterium sp. TaxID=239 RepID=UPI003528825B
METSNVRSIASLNHLSALSQYFFPFGNYIFPLLIWSFSKNKSSFNNFHGKQSLNFQLSILLYSLILLCIAIPIFIFWLVDFINNTNIDFQSIEIETTFTNQNITGFIIIGLVAVLLFLLLKATEFFLIIYAAVKSANGEYYKYPLTIHFIK